MAIKITKPSQEEIELAHTWPTWSKEVSEFDWDYDQQETCLIIQGRARVTDNYGKSVEFGAGDWVIFPPGLKCHWHITSAMKKHYKFD